MSSRTHKRSSKSGLPPGTLVPVGTRHDSQTCLRLLHYGSEECLERAVKGVADLPPLTQDGILWLDCTGLNDTALLDELGQAFSLHPLLLEDVLNTEQRPKVEDYGDYLFVVLKHIQFDQRSGHLAAEQVSLVLGPNFVLSFRESGNPSFEPIRQRLHSQKSRLRRSGADFLLHALMDCVVDEYFLALEGIGEDIEQLEEQILERPSPVANRTLHRLKRELITMRKLVWPMRELIAGLDRSDSPLLSAPLDIYLRDVYDHTVHVIDTVESYRDTLAGVLDIYLSSLSNRMNEVMKLLTIISTIFIPLTFIAGIYGMNFRNMPELEWPLGYFLVLGFMFALSLGMLFFFRRKRWL